MPNMVREDDRGFTLIEVLVTVLIIGLLAAIALPSFVGQGDKARDAGAESDARNLVTQVESCFTETQTYARCETGDPDLSDDGSRATARRDGDGYEVTATSATGNVFTIAVSGLGTVRTCTTQTPKAGCRAGSW